MNPKQFVKKVSEYIDALDRLQQADRRRLRKLHGSSGGRR